MHHLLEHIRTHKALLTGQCASKFGQLSPAYQKIDLNLWNASSEAVVDQKPSKAGAGECLQGGSLLQVEITINVPPLRERKGDIALQASMVKG